MAEKQLTEKEQIALKAVTHILNRIHDHPHIGWYMGFCTESFSLLVEAYCALTGESSEIIEEKFAPINPQEPKK